MTTTDIDVRHALAVAERAVLQTGDPLRAAFGTAPYTYKSSSAADIVTPLDVETEERLDTALAQFDDGVGTHGEELGAGVAGIVADGTYWLVDPIDGTAHYVRGLPFCTTMVALIHEGRPVVAVINDFVGRRLYSASLGGGATMNGQPISVSGRRLAESYVTAEMNLGAAEVAQLFARLQQRSVVMATISCGYDFAMIAEGRIDGRITRAGYGKTYDYAPGALLVAEAGGVVTNIGSGGYDYRNLDSIAASPRVHADLTSGEGCLFPLM